MRSLIVVTLLAFLAIGFVAAHPAVEEETLSDVVESTADDNETTTEVADAVESAGESSDDVAKEESTTAAAVEKHIRFWPRFGGHGPVVIRHHPDFE